MLFGFRGVQAFFICRLENSRVFMGGKAVLYSVAGIVLPDENTVA